jgi:translation initiation factor IF-3
MVVFIVGYFNRYNIDQHDYSVRLKAARKFLADGDKVTLIIFTWHIKHTYSIYHLQVY